MDCVDCGSPGVGTCRRCQGSLCEAHAADGWCDTCFGAVFPGKRKPNVPSVSAPAMTTTPVTTTAIPMPPPEPSVVVELAPPPKPTRWERVRGSLTRNRKLW